MKQQFPKLSYGKLSHEQLIALITDVVLLWKGQEVIPYTVQQLIATAPELIATIEKILVRERADAHTELTNESDDKRDRAYSQLIRKIRLFTTEFDETIAEAANRLMPVAEKFGADITRLSYKEQSVRTTLAINEFREEKNFADLTLIGLVADLDRADQFNSEFEVIYQEGMALDAGKEDLPLMRIVRRDLGQQLRLLLDITTYLYNESNSVSDTLFDQISGELVKYATLTKTRETRAEAELAE